MEKELKTFFEGEIDKWTKIFDYHSDVSNERHTIMRMTARVEIDYFKSKLSKIKFEETERKLKERVDNPSTLSQ